MIETGSELKGLLVSVTGEAADLMGEGRQEGSSDGGLDR